MLKIKKFKKSLAKASAFLLAANVLFSNVSNVEARSEESETKEVIETMVTDSDFSDTTQDIIKNIVDNTDSESVLDSIRLSLKYGESDADYLIETIYSAAYVQEKEHFKEAYQKAQYDPYLFMEYNIDEISIVDNLDGKIKGLPKQICLLTKSAEYGEYLIYKIYSDNDYSFYEDYYVVVNKDGKVISSASLISNSYTDISKKDISLTSFKQFLKDNKMTDLIKENYSYIELFENLTFDISKRLCECKNNKLIDDKDILVVDNTGGMCLAENNNQMYYFIVKVCPYLFIEGRDMYRDVINEDARITVDPRHTLRYSDFVNDVSLYNEDLHFVDGASHTDCLLGFKEFMKMKNFSSMKKVSDDFLVGLNKIFMDKDEIILPQLDNYDGSSIVEALEQNGYNSSKEYRAVLAVLLNIIDFNYTALDNGKMLSLLRNR